MASKGQTGADGHLDVLVVFTVLWLDIYRE